jgi:hypothetical protein
MIKLHVMSYWTLPKHRVERGLRDGHWVEKTSNGWYRPCKKGDLPIGQFCNFPITGEPILIIYHI